MLNTISDAATSGVSLNDYSFQVGIARFIIRAN